jgi:hypothetical protein
VDPALYKVETFTPHVGSQFDLQLQEVRIPLRLTEVRTGTPTPRILQFALTFHGPLQPPLPQHMYDLHHEVLGDMALFLVPIGEDSGGRFYEVVFNRFLPTPPALDP